jgi:hypothetical protein
MPQSPDQGSVQRGKTGRSCKLTRAHTSLRAETPRRTSGRSSPPTGSVTMDRACTYETCSRDAHTFNSSEGAIRSQRRADLFKRTLGEEPEHPLRISTPKLESWGHPMPKSRAIYKQQVAELLQTASLVFIRWKTAEANQYKLDSAQGERDVTTLLDRFAVAVASSTRQGFDRRIVVEGVIEGLRAESVLERTQRLIKKRLCRELEDGRSAADLKSPAAEEIQQFWEMVSLALDDALAE